MKDQLQMKQCLKLEKISLIKCEIGEKRCDDGSCRTSKEFCPKAKTCPKGEIRCENGSCAPSNDTCPGPEGCKLENPYKCPKSGYCVKDPNECEEKQKKFDKSNGCPSEAPIKCPLTHKCVETEDKCGDLDSS